MVSMLEDVLQLANRTKCSDLFCYTNRFVLLSKIFFILDQIIEYTQYDKKSYTSSRRCVQFLRIIITINLSLTGTNVKIYLV